MTLEVNINEICNAYQQASSRLIILDYDGTLVPFETYPDLARPSNQVKGLIQHFADDFSNKVIVTSGRDKESMDAFLGDLSVVLMAEHGGFTKVRDTWEPISSHCLKWIPRAIRVLNALKGEYAGSTVEHKSLSIAWHYRAIADRMPPDELKQIEVDLTLLGRYENFIVCHTEETIELRTPGIDKGLSVAEWIGFQRFDFILAMGDSDTDEDLFKALPDTSITIKVGRPTRTAARFHLDTQKRVIPLLQSLADDANRTGDSSYGS